MSFNATSRLRVAAAAIALATLGSAPAAAACQRTPIRYELAPQYLDIALHELERRSGCSVKAVPALVRGKRTQAVHGSLTPDVALIAMVRGTGLEADADHGGLEVNREQQQYFAAQTTELGRQLSAARLAPAKRRALAALVARVRVGVPTLVREQGFLSAAERTGYSAVLDQVTTLLKQ